MAPNRTMTRRLKPATMARYLSDLVAGLSADEWSAGHAWYAEGNSFCVYLSTTYGVSVDVAACLVAALSPRERWSSNKRLAESALSQWLSVPFTGGLRLGTLGSNAERARAVLVAHDTGADPFSAIGNGVKVRAFAHALNGDLSQVVVDTWAVRAATRGRYDRPGRFQSDLEEAYRILATDLGVAPSQAQAISWVAIRGAAE